MIMIHRGLKYKLFDALAATADTKSDSAAISNGSMGKMLTWQTSFASAPSAVSWQLQVAMEDVDALYSVLDTSTDVNGETRNVVWPGNFNFIRARQVSRTGGTLATCQVLLS